MNNKSKSEEKELEMFENQDNEEEDFESLDSVREVEIEEYVEKDKVIVTSGLSKSFSHPGIRIGWLAASEDLIEKAWGIKDYTTVASSILSQHIACKVLESETITKLRFRARALLLENLEVFEVVANAEMRENEY